MRPSMAAYAPVEADQQPRGHSRGSWQAADPSRRGRSTARDGGRRGGQGRL